MIVERRTLQKRGGRYKDHEKEKRRDDERKKVVTDQGQFPLGHISKQLPTRTIPHRTGIRSDERFIWLAVVLVGVALLGELSWG